MTGGIARTLGGALAALRNFLRGFVGLAGAAGPVADEPAHDAGAQTPAGARDALARRAANRKSCC